MITLALLIATISSYVSFNSYGDKVAKIGQMKNIVVTDLRSKRSINDDLLIIQATLKNQDDSIERTIYYRCQFYTINKFDLNKDTNWNSIYIDAGQSSTVECTSESREAATFKLELSSSDKASKVY